MGRNAGDAMSRHNLLLLRGGLYRQKTMAELQEARAAKVSEIQELSREIEKASTEPRPSRRHDVHPCPTCTRRRRP